VEEKKETTFEEIVRLLKARKDPGKEFWLCRCPFCYFYMALFPERNRYVCFSLATEEPSCKEGTFDELLVEVRNLKDSVRFQTTFG
jgi:hypothetical protein